VNTRRSVAVAIRDPAHAGRVLIVQRPDDDEDLPGAWGLPAATRGPGESWEDAARRAARDKLGVELAGLERVSAGRLRRPDYVLGMDLVTARLAAGVPAVPQQVAGVTQYQACRWGDAGDLEPAAARGSLCSRLYLDWRG
jgi:8-oxo-dGTP diphosphatase